MANKTYEELEALKEAFVDAWEITGPRVLVEVTRPKSELPESKLYIPDAVKTQDRHAMVTGVVRAMGNTCYNLASHTNPANGQRERWCEVGDTVMFGQYSGDRMLEEGCEFLYVLNDEDIRGRKRKEK